MAHNDVFQGKMDQEIAALLGVNTPAQNNEAIPDYASLFNDHEPEETQGDTEELDLTSTGFPEIIKSLEETPHQIFDDPNYYKTAIQGEGDISQRVHGLLQKFMNAKDPKDKGVFRQQLITSFWEFFTNVGKKAPGNLPDPKKFLLRFGILHPTFINQNIRTFFARVIVENTLNQPVYYLDEWLKAVGTGMVRNSSTDEVRVGKSSQNVKLQQMVEKAKGRLDGVRVILKAKDVERLALEKNLIERAAQIADHYPVAGLTEVNSCYTDIQKRIFADIQELLKTLLKADREQDALLRDFYQADADFKSLKDKVEEEGEAIEIDMQAVVTELDTVRQMAKMTIGRQGNHFPILTSEYLHIEPSDVGYRENVISMLAWIESIDSEAYCRSYKNRLNRIPPYVVLIPSYGEFGMCWEPFDRFNRATSRGRIAIPLHPKSLQYSLLYAVADLRWQVAKEKASYYWMEEGITGNYYQWFQKMKLKGDLKEAFVQDYITWMTKESDGIQKLDKEVRGVFWRHMPFSQPVKEKLKNRSYVYQELYQRDVNRSMSDGY